MGWVETALGRIDSGQLGTTLMHEHLWIDLSFRFKEPKDPQRKKAASSPISMGSLGYLRRGPHLSKENLRLDSEEAAVQELAEFKRFGGSSVVEQSLEGNGRNPLAVQSIAKLSGLNIVISTGWYKHESHPTLIRRASVEELAGIMISEVEDGIGNTGIKAGVIGECAASTPLPYHEHEKKVLEAACRAQSKTGTGFTFHQQYIPLYNTVGSKIEGKVYEHYLDIVAREDANLDKFYLSHSDGTLADLEYQCKIMDRGVTLEYDTFGMEYYYDYAITAEEGAAMGSRVRDSFPRPIGTRDVTDAERVKAISELCRRGYAKNLLLSQDICHKTELKLYGGFGYSHILETIVPWLRQEGVSDAQVRTMLVDNPRRILERS